MKSAFQQLSAAIASDTGWTVESSRPSGPRPGKPVEPDTDVLLIFDGGSIGNPGAGYGSFAYKGRAVRWPTRVDFPGLTTNNQAEYQTLIAALRGLLFDLESLDIPATDLSIEVRSDSQLLVNQLGERWKIKNPGLRLLHAQAMELLDRFARWGISWHPRSESVRVLGH